MNNIWKALFWAVAILLAAWVGKANGMSEAATWGIVLGLSGAAIATLRNDRTASESCK